jgi:hypothetical protein
MSVLPTSSLLPARPAAAFGFLAIGLCVVASRVVASQSPNARPSPFADAPSVVELEEAAPVGLEERTRAELPPTPITLTALDYAEPPLAELLDRNGEVLATSVRGHTVEASPYHLWLVHTPQRILDGLALVLGEHAPVDLERRLLGTDEYGWCSVDEWHLEPAEARAVAAWIEAGGPTRHPELGVLPGLVLEACRPADGVGDLFFRLRWNPSLLLSEQARRRIDRNLFDDQLVSAAAWVRALSDDLWELLAGPRERALLEHAATNDTPPEGYELVPPPGALARALQGRISAPRSWRVSAAVPTWQIVGSRREWIFAGLVASRYEKLCASLPIEKVESVRAFLEQEHVGGFQVWLRPTSEREYPQGRHAVLGRVGWRADDLTRRHGRWGLEHAAEAALAGFGIERTGSIDEFVRHVLVRVRADDQEYYGDHTYGAEPPRVVSTIDARLQQKLALALERVENENDTSLTMGIVIDLETRDVLALDWRDPYALGTYAPVQHGFTPGSTFKVVTMALALDAGVVSPDETFDVGWGAFLVPGTRRVVGEAEGFATGTITASECLARSSNAGMIQIGLMLSPKVWIERTAALGYGRPSGGDLIAPGMSGFKGVIGEHSRGPNDNTWARARSHTSVCFGDSMSINLLQHATAISAIVSDGRVRPLRFVDAVIDGNQRFDLPESEGPQVLKPSTSAKVRAMMRLGATEGTGKRIPRPEGLELATKTGTYEKLRGDVSYHVLGRALAEARASGAVWNGGEAYRQHRGNWDGRNSAYTSSIVAVGNLEGSDRRVLVFLLAEDPLGEEHFGSYVTGDAAVEVLASALGFDEREAERLAVLEDGRPRLSGVYVPTAEELPERPWEAVGRP